MLQGAQVPIEPFDLLSREIQLHFAFLNPFTQPCAANLISSDRITVLISRVIPLEAAAETIASPPTQAR
jgi:L-iditol 2-dehydrogenase